MKFDKLRLISGTCLALILLLDGTAVYAKDKPKPKAKPPVKITTDIKTQLTSDNDMDLDTAGEGGSDSQILELKSKLEGRSGEHVSFLVEARGVKNFGEGGSFDTETGEPTGREDFAELRQYWVGFDNLFGGEALSFRVGRQRIREDYGFWWNRDFDALRAFYNTETLKGFLGVGQNLTEYRSSGDNFNQDDEDILRVFGEASKEWNSKQFLEGRFLYQDDHSGIETTGDVVKADDYDSADGNLLWMGLRVHGALNAEAAKDKKDYPSYRLDLVTVMGEEDELTTSAGPGTSFRTVTGSGDQDVMGWAVDAGIEIPVPLPTNPILYAGYAYGSGDDDAGDGDDNGFRQTDMDGNSSKLGDFSAAVNNYGSVLRPDLSNLHILTAGLTVPLGEATQLGGFYHYYRLAEEEGEIISTVSAPLNGTDSDLGHGLDVILNMNVGQQFGIEQDAVKRINFKTTLGAFRAGEAYGDAHDETALRGQVDLGIRF